jgi:hypothetical protein
MKTTAEAKTTELDLDMVLISKNKPLSQIQIRAKVQHLIENNMQYANGRFHCKELNEGGFLRDLFKNFTLTPIDKNHE